MFVYNHMQKQGMIVGLIKHNYWQNI